MEVWGTSTPPFNSTSIGAPNHMTLRAPSIQWIQRDTQWRYFKTNNTCCAFKAVSFLLLTIINRLPQMHIVNKRKDLNLTDAIKTPDGLAVLGFLIEVKFSVLQCSILHTVYIQVYTSAFLDVYSLELEAKRFSVLSSLQMSKVVAAVRTISR